VQKFPYGSFKYVGGDINTVKESFMNRKLIFSVLLVVCLLAVVTVVAFAQTGPNVRWEYTFVNIGRGVSLNQLNQRASELGTQGWEAVGMVDGYDGSFSTVMFKRRLP
jgi:hypothetical protein